MSGDDETALASFDDFIRILVNFFHYFKISEIKTYNKNIIFLNQ